MSRKHEPISLTVTRTGTKYKIEDVPQEIRDATIEVEVTQEGTLIGTYEAHGWVSEGAVYYLLPDDYPTQLQASQARTATEPPSDKDKAAVAKVLKEK